MQHRIISRIESKRNELGMSVRELSEKSGVPESTYNNIVHGRSKDPSYDRLRVLAIAVDLSPVEFMDAISATTDGQETPISESLQKEMGKVATGYDLDYLADTFIRVSDQFAADFRLATQSKNEEFQRAILSKDEQFEKERQSHLITNAAKDAHIEHTKDQPTRYAAQFRRYNIGAFVLIGLCAFMFGMMIFMFINNRALSAQIRDLQDHIVELAESAEDDFPTE